MILFNGFPFINSDANDTAELAHCSKRKFRQEWLSTFDWLEEKGGTPFCKVCSKPLSTHFAHLKVHEKSTAHLQNYDIKKKNFHIEKFFNTEQKRKSQQVKHAEFMLVMVCITYNLPFLLMD